MFFLSDGAIGFDIKAREPCMHIKDNSRCTCFQEYYECPCEQYIILEYWRKWFKKNEIGKIKRLTRQEYMKNG